MPVINDFSYLFTKDSIHITRWDSIDINIADLILTPYKDTIIRMIQFADEFAVDKHNKLGLFLCDGRNLTNMISFLSAVIEKDVEVFNLKAIPAINDELHEWNAYGEEAWVLWRRYLQDVIDAVLMWSRSQKEQRIQVFLRNCMR